MIRSAALLLVLFAMPAAAADWRQTLPATVTVAGNAELQRALAAASPGQVIALAPGDYQRVTMKNANWDAPVMIRSRDADNPARLLGMDISNVHGLWLQDLRFAPAAVNPQATGYLVNIANSSNVAIVASEVHGRIDDDFSNDPYGVNVTNSEKVLFAGNQVHHVGRGIVTGASWTVRITGNKFFDCRTDAADFANVWDVEVDNNHFTRMHPVGADHPDFVQFWTRGTAAPSEKVYIHDNVMLQGHDRATQAIFIGNEVPGWNYRNFVIERNVIYNSSPHGISLYDVIGGRVSNNTIVQFPGTKNAPRLNLMGAQELEVTGNVVPQLVQNKDAARNRTGGNFEIRDNDPARLFADPRAGAAATAASLTPLANGPLVVRGAAIGALPAQP